MSPNDVLKRFVATFVVLVAIVVARGVTTLQAVALAVFGFVLFGPWIVAYARWCWRRLRERRAT